MFSSSNHITDWRKRFIAVLALLLCSAVGVMAQAKFYATAPKSVPVNQGFQLTYTLENGNGGNLKLPPLDDFQLIGGPSTSSNMQWINGNVTQSMSYTYVLKPKKEGTFTIGKGTIQIDGVTMQSNSLNIEVTQAVARQPANQNQNQYNPFDPFSDPFFSQGQQEDNEPAVSKADLAAQLKKDVFIKLIVSKSSVYKGEMLTATYKLYFRQNLSSFNITEAPAFDGFWSQEVDLDPKRRPSVETVDGKQYNTIDILQYNLYPQRAGKLTIPPAEISTVAQVSVRRKSHGFFDDFFNMGSVQQVPLDLKTTSAAINVKALPDKGKPADFDGAVGSFTFQASLSSKDAKTGEPITYTAKISGTGNLKFIDPPKVQFPASFEAYDPKLKENYTGAGNSSGSKQYDYLLVPHQPGNYTFNAQHFSYFDPSRGQYLTINSPEFALKVTGAPVQTTNPAVAATGSNQAAVALLGHDIRYIKTQTPEFSQRQPFFASAGYTALFISPFFMFIGLIVLKRRNENMASDIVGTKRRRALKLAKKRLSVANKLLGQQDKKAFYNEISRALWGYLGDKLTIDMAELSKDNVEEKLLARSVRPETITKLKELLNTCDLALYSPVGEGSEMKLNYQAAMNLMADFEDEIKSKQMPPQATPRYMSLLLLLITSSFIFFAAPAHANDTPQSLYSQAATLYKAGKYDQAAADYEKLVAQHFGTFEVYYNLGNCYYKLNKIGPCILNYEKAHRLSPNDEDINYNLQLAELRTTDKIQPVPELGIITWWHQFITSQSAKGWGIIALVLVWLAFVAFAVYLFIGFRRTSATLGSLLLIFAIAFLSLAFTQRNQETDSGEAVLMVADSYVKSAPDNNGNNVFQLHEGTKFLVLDKVGDWHKIRLADGKTGWIENGSFSRI